MGGNVGGAWDAGTPEAHGLEDSGKNTSGFSGPVVRMEPIMGMENPWRYRNKAQFPFGRSKDGRIITGFYAGGPTILWSARTVCWGWRRTA